MAEHMASGSVCFEGFALDPENRRLTRDGEPLELNARYLDALVLLVSEPGKLVSKDRFLADVWRGVPVTDEALTQCIRTLRKQLGDDASAPRFIETVPKHGYRFIAPVAFDAENRGTTAAAGVRQPKAGTSWRQFFLLGGAGTLGGALAGFIGGLLYGFGGASQPLEPGMGAVSVLLVLVAITTLVATVGAAGVSFGIAATGLAPGPPRLWSIFGGAGGGMLVGAFVKLLGLDAFDLLFGQSPGDITGAPEGALLGAAVGLGAWLASSRAPGRRRGVAVAALAGGAAGVVIPLLGGRMMGGSLDLLARSLPGSRLRLDPIGALFGEQGFGPVSHPVTGGLEGALFGGCIVGAMILARRSMGDASS